MEAHMKEAVNPPRPTIVDMAVKTVFWSGYKAL